MHTLPERRHRELNGPRQRHQSEGRSRDLHLGHSASGLDRLSLSSEHMCDHLSLDKHIRFISSAVTHVRLNIARIPSKDFLVKKLKNV